MRDGCGRRLAGIARGVLLPRAPRVDPMVALHRMGAAAPAVLVGRSDVKRRLLQCAARTLVHQLLASL